MVGLSILSGSHLELIPETVRLLREHGVDAPVVVGGIIPVADADKLREAGVARVYTPEGLRRQPDHGRDRRPVGRATARGAADSAAGLLTGRTR